MSKSTKRPTNLIEAVRYFSDLDVCTDFVAGLRWPSGPVCPRCGSVEYSYLSTRRVWKCKANRVQSASSKVERFSLLCYRRIEKGTQVDVYSKFGSR